MQPLLAFWNALEPSRKLILGLVTVGTFILVLTTAYFVTKKDMALLYAGVDERAAAQIITELEQANVLYEVRGDSLYVDAALRDKMRLQIAGSGLTNFGPQGYELLDSLSGFSTTSQMFDAAYWRAKEGELARTILALPQVTSARVHISATNPQGFLTQSPASAAVTLTLRGGMLSQQQIQAIRALVAAAVPRLDVKSVSVIDSALGLLRPDDETQMLDARLESLRERVTHLLEAHVGRGNAIIEIAQETITESEAVVERRIDPESRAIVSSEVIERNRTTEGNISGAVTVASNLPDGDAGQGGSTRQDNDQENRNLTNFDFSETQREIIRTPGAIKRLTVAVLVNQPENDTRVASDLNALRDLVSAAVGLDASRGDTLTLHALPFQPIADVGTEAIIPPVQAAPWTLIFGLIAAGLALVGLLVFALRKKTASAASSLPPLAEDDDDDVFFQIPMNIAPALPPAARLRTLISERRTESNRLLQDWLENSAREQ